jgi:hypothetical protein
MPLDKTKVDRMIAKMDAWLTQREQDRERDIINPLDAPPSEPFYSDSPPDMPKEPLWGGKPPVPIEHL